MKYFASKFVMAVAGSDTKMEQTTWQVLQDKKWADTRKGARIRAAIERKMDESR